MAGIKTLGNALRRLGDYLDLRHSKELDARLLEIAETYERKRREQRADEFAGLEQRELEDVSLDYF